MHEELIQVVPALPPVVSGVGDYALLLARELAARHGVRTRFLSSNLVTPDGRAEVAPFPAQVIARREARVWQEALENTAGRTILLHYVGYGYARRGCPFWLVRALERWKQRTRGNLIVLFHELSGSGPIWSSGFWTSGLQTWLARRLARLATALRITTAVAAGRLRALAPPARQIRTLAVFSTLGEPSTSTPPRERRRQMVVFGSEGWRRDAYTRHLPALVDACARLNIERVVDLGAPTGLRPALPAPFVEAGLLGAPEASGLLAQSLAGFFTYPVRHIGKSTIFAAYCAHALVPVTFAANGGDGDEGLRGGKHFLAGPGPDAADEHLLAEVAASAHAWYGQHRLRIHASELHQTLSGLTAG